MPILNTVPNAFLKYIFISMQGVIGQRQDSFCNKTQTIYVLNNRILVFSEDEFQEISNNIKSKV